MIRIIRTFEEIMSPGGRRELGLAEEGEAGIATLFRCSLTTAKPNAVDKTATSSSSGKFRSMNPNETPLLGVCASLLLRENEPIHSSL